MVDFIEFMLKSDALMFGDFTLKSGRKSPYFINAGNFYKEGEQLSKLGDFYAAMIKNSGEQFDVLFGPAYKGIPLAAVVAARLSQEGIKRKFSFDRKERKDHGEGGKIVGYLPKDGDRIAIIEDVTTAGTSVREIMSLLEDSNINAKITALYISVDRMEKGAGIISATEQISIDYGINVYSIITVRDITEYLESGKSAVKGAAGYAAKMRGYLNEYGA